MTAIRQFSSWLGKIAVAVALAVGLTVASGAGNAVTAKTLSIPPVAQNQSNWCWLASAEMVFRYYHVPAVNPVSFQCGLAAAYIGGPCLFNCGLCNVGSGPVETLQRLVVEYPAFVRQIKNSNTPDLLAEVAYGALSAEDLIAEIDSQRPVIAGISPHSGLLPPGLSEHAIVIVGYQGDADDLSVILNDPFPYTAVGMIDPYTQHGGVRIQSGRYRIAYDALVGPLAWGNTISGIGRDE